MKIPEFKRSGIRLIAEFCGIRNGFPNKVWEEVSSTGTLQECQQAEGLLFSRQECQLAEEYKRTFWKEIGPFCAAASKPSKDHQEQASTLLHVYHWWQKNLFDDPEVLLAVEFGPWPWRLQEQNCGASARAASRQGAQSGHQQRPHQLVDAGLDSSNKAEAAHLVKASSKPTSLAFLEGTANILRLFWERAGNGTVRNNLQK